MQGKGGNQAAKAVADVLGLAKKQVKDLRSIDGVAVELSGAQVLALAADKHVTRDHAGRTRPPLGGRGTRPSNEKWPYVTGVNKYGSAPAATIAIVDSGIDASRPEFAGRIAANVNLSTLSGNSPGDGRGHGTFVAGIAAGKLAGQDGAAPNAKLVSIDVMDDQGMARTSDVIVAADWILANKAQYGIKVANFSLHSSVANSFMYDPLDKAVERLWFNGVVVVAAAGNYGYPDRPSGVPFAPGNDPVRHHGRRERHGQVRLDERRRRGAVVGLRLHAGRVREAGPRGAGPLHGRAGPGRLRRSTRSAPTTSSTRATWSFRARPSRPRSSAAIAALILGKHPNFTPDQVKGALMLGAKPLPKASGPVRRRRRGQRRPLDRVLEPAEREQGAATSSSSRDPITGAARLRRGQLGRGREGGRLLGERLVGLGLLGRGLVGLRLLG